MPALEARGVELSWSERGVGPAVLLVHETAAGSAAWALLAAALADSGSRAISYDRRGWGASGVPEGYRRTTIEEQSEDAATLLEATGAVPARLCGAGTGAVIALDLLLRRPELVEAAVLVEPPLLALVPEATEQLSGDLAAVEGAAGEGPAALAELYLSGRLGALAAGADRLPAEMTGPARERPLSLLAELGSVPAWGMPFARLGEADRPSVVVTSPSTPPLVAAAAAALEARLAGARAERIGSGELPPHLGAPDALAAVVAGL